MSAIPAHIESYFARLHKRRNDAEHFPFRQVWISNRIPLPNKCHDNVDDYCAVNPTCEAVRGWLIGASGGGDNTMYVAHSIVRDAGETYDITPLIPPDVPFRFLKHHGTEAEFDELKIAWSGRFYPFVTELLPQSAVIDPQDFY